MITKRRQFYFIAYNGLQLCEGKALGVETFNKQQI